MKSLTRGFIFVMLITAKAIAQTPIDTVRIVTIGGIKQYLTVKGKDDTKPLLLFLHGGPGGSVMAYAEKFTALLQEKFVVIQWDQRETGKTLQLNASPVPLTLRLFQQDTYELITFLLKEFQRNKLYLAGHSWGTTLGFYTADKHPELLHAYIAIGPMINQLESERIILEMMKDKAKKSKNQIELDELATVQIPFGNAEQLYYHRKWLFHFNGRPNKNFTKQFATDWCNRWLSVYNEACTINLMESLPVIDCPVYFFAGRKDFQTNSSITESYFKKVKAPKKNLFWFEKSAHAVPTSEPALMQDIIINRILPETN